MKFNLLHIFILISIISCGQNDLVNIANYKNHKISEYIAVSNVDSINEVWVKKDSLFLSELKQILKENPSNIIDILKIDKSDIRTELGFEYEQIKSSMGKGYAGVYYNLILKEGQVISYEFTPNFPSNKNLKFLMTPFSGTRYGFSGGYLGSIFTNRAIFLEESKNINPEVCRILMNSINPSTRLMAIEYYMKNKSDFENFDLINNWIEKVYLELPTIETLSGCFVIQRNSKELVSEYVKRKN